QWVGFNGVQKAQKDPATFPDWSPAIASSMRAETDAFISNVVLDGDGTLDTLLTAPYTVIDDSLAKFYGVTMQAGTGARRVDLDPAQ
ncbi:DUF1592 domain-containing protein, partial [Acinetobacter baumannii]